MRLTRRQTQFLADLLQLWQDYEHRPIHYSDLAKQVGVSRFTAYDMLKLLEDKGFVESSYVLTEDKSGPGRSVVMFRPTRLAEQRMLALTSEQSDVSWGGAKKALIDRIQRGDVYEPDLVEAILGRVPTASSAELTFCIELIAVLLLHISQDAFQTQLIHILPDTTNPDPQQLNLLAGYALGVLAHERPADPDWSLELIDHVKQYQSIVLRLNTADQRALAKSLVNVLAPLHGSTGSTPSTTEKQQPIA